MTINGHKLITRAMDFAARAHADQRRKGAKGEPYVNHLTEVADLVGEATDYKDAVLIAAALLHDVIEDFDVTHAELVTEFGAEVADVVRECSDDTSLPRLERKRLQVQHIPHLSTRAKLVKLADKTSNLRAIDRTPPEGWSRDRKAEYVNFGRQIAAGAKGIAPKLDARFREISEKLGRDLQMDPAGPRP